jgi:hypothetical protein
MRRMTTAFSGLPIALLLALPGCGRLGYETTVQLGAGEVQALSIDAPRSEQKVSVAVTSSGSPVDVYAVVEKDKEAAKEALLDRRKPAAFLAGQAKTQDATVEATVPGHTAFVILVGGASKPTQVHVKVMGR